MGYKDIVYYVLASLPEQGAMIVGNIYGKIAIMQTGARTADPGIFTDAYVTQRDRVAVPILAPMTIFPWYATDQRLPVEHISLATLRVFDRYELRCGYGKLSHIWVTDGRLRTIEMVL